MQQKLITTNPLPNIELPSLGYARPETRQRKLPRHHPKRKAKPFGSSKKRLADWRRACRQAYEAKIRRCESYQGSNSRDGIPASFLESRPSRN